MTGLLLFQSINILLIFVYMMYLRQKVNFLLEDMEEVKRKVIRQRRYGESTV